MRDFDTGSDSQSIPDGIEAAASDSESVRDFGGTGSDSQSIPDDIESAASDSESVKHGMDVSDDDSIQYFETDSHINDNNCQRARIHTKHNEEKFKPKNLVPSQILIMQGNNTPFSSDESVLDVCIDDNVQENCKMYNPWGEMNVNDIPLDINTDTNSNTSSEPAIVNIEELPDVVFSPLSNIECLNAAKKFCIKLRPSEHTICFKGIGLVLKNRPVVTIAAKLNGACLFNSISLLLCGTDVYSQIIRHVLCNYMSAPQN